MGERRPGGSEGARRGDVPSGPGGRDVLAYYAYKATAAVELYRPVMYLYFLATGLSFTQIALLEVVYNVTTVAGEVPTGYVGDRVGRRNSLLVGTVLIAATLFGIGLAGSFLALAGLYVAWSLGYTFRSGSEDAWLYDALADDRAADEFARVRGRGESVSLVTGVAGGVVGGYLGGVDLAYPFFVAAGVTALGVVGLLAMGEPRTGREDGDGAGSPALGFRRALGIVRDSVSDRSIRAFVVYYFVLFAAVTYLAFIFLQPVFEVVAIDAGLAPGDVEPALGWFYAAYSLLGAGLAYGAGTIRERVGLRRWFYALPFVVGGSLAGSFVLPLLALPALLLTRGVADVTRALAGQYVNDRIESVGRATVLSAMTMVSALAVVPFQLAAGALADATSALAALAAGGGVLVVGAAALLLLSDPVRSVEARPDCPRRRPRSGLPDRRNPKTLPRPDRGRYMEDSHTVRIDVDGDDAELEVPSALVAALSEPGDSPPDVVADLVVMSFAGRAHALLHHAEADPDDDLRAAEAEMMDRFEERFGVTYAEATGHSH